MTGVGIVEKGEAIFCHCRGSRGQGARAEAPGVVGGVERVVEWW